MKKHKIIALIPARGGSKSIPKKNIVDLGGHPLIAYSIVAAKLSKYISRVIVSTDSKEIAEIAKEYGAEVPFMRPTEISADRSLDIEFVKHALNFLEQKEKYIPDLVIHLSPVVPLREPEIIDKAIREILADNEATSLRSGHLYRQTAYKLTKLKKGYWEFLGGEDFDKGYEYYNQPRQLLPKTYIPATYVDILLPKTLKETGLLHGNKIKAFIIEPTADIDDLIDLKHARELLQDKRYKKLIQKINENKNGQLS